MNIPLPPPQLLGSLCSPSEECTNADFAATWQHAIDRIQVATAQAPPPTLESIILLADRMLMFTHPHSRLGHHDQRQQLCIPGPRFRGCIDNTTLSRLADSYGKLVELLDAAVLSATYYRSAGDSSSTDTSETFWYGRRQGIESTPKRCTQSRARLGRLELDEEQTRVLVLDLVRRALKGVVEGCKRMVMVLCASGLDGHTAHMELRNGDDRKVLGVLARATRLMERVSAVGGASDEEEHIGTTHLGAAQFRGM